MLLSCRNCASPNEALAQEPQDWARRPGGPRLVVCSYHHEDPDDAKPSPGRKRNTALAWVRATATMIDMLLDKTLVRND